MRSEGFEPPTYCSGADDWCDHVWITRGRHQWCVICGSSESNLAPVDGYRLRSQACANGDCDDCLGGGCMCGCHAYGDSFNPPCPVCGWPLVWGVCTRSHEAAVWELAA